jgi:NAD(P)-dependent dehydrogenase (short-subunit alcohol dehydrogenase family)
MSVIDTFRLDGKIALLTGGAGKYGRQILAALAEAGARVYIASRDLDALEAVAAEHRAQGHDVTALQFDQGDEASILALVAEITKRDGRVDILVNNAVGRTMRGAEDDAERFAESMTVNATGIFILTRAVCELMSDKGGCSIINIASIFGMVGYDPWVYEGTEMKWGLPDYSFVKGGMINFTRFIASYYGSRGIRCNTISPGGLYNESKPERFVEQYGRTTCLGRIANSTDLMGAIVFLASDASAYVTGVNLPVDGGRTAI